MHFSKTSSKLIALTMLGSALALAAVPPARTSPLPNNPGRTPAEPAPVTDGLQFNCAPEQATQLKQDMQQYLSALSIPLSLVVLTENGRTGQLTYTLTTPAADTDTLSLKTRPEMAITDENVLLPAAQDGLEHTITTVSKKEILLALMQHGRLTEFSGRACTVAAVQDQVGLRQNIVAWAQTLTWDWPEGESAKWNTHYWKDGDLKPGAKLEVAIHDAFIHQSKYSIGCYTATKLVMLQSILDYYRRVHPDADTLTLVEQRLFADNDPLIHLEPEKMWSVFDPGLAKADSEPGKLLQIQEHIAPKNFVPGDWLYFLNTDPVSSKKTGYEGSNAIYLGRNKFDDYYNDNHHSYTYQQKMDEVYQWHNGVFSRSRDFAKIKPLTDADIEHLSLSPEKGGILRDIRVSPHFFGYADLPELSAATQTVPSGSTKS